MSNSRANSLGWSHGERLTHTQANGLDEGQVNAITRTGTTTCTGDTVIDADGFDLTLSAPGGTLYLDCDGGFPHLDSRVVTDHAPPFNFMTDTTADWLSRYAGSAIDADDYVALARGSSAIGRYYLQLPIGMVITSVSLGVKGLTGGALPDTKPSIALRRYTSSSYATPAATVGSATDSSADYAAYSVGHLITIPSLTHAVLQGSQYVLEYTNAIDGTLADTIVYLYRPFVTGTLATLRTA